MLSPLASELVEYFVAERCYSSDIDYGTYELKFANEATLKKLLELAKAGTKGLENPHNSTLLYLISATDQLNPIKRVDTVGGSPADIDMDFPSYGRDILRNYVVSLYGSDKVAKVGTIGTFGMRELVSDWIRPRLPLPVKKGDHPDDYEEAVAAFEEETLKWRDIERNIKALIPKPVHGMAPDLVRTFEASPQIAELYPEFWKFASTLYDQRKKQGVHAGGLVIFDTPIMEYFPLQVGKKDQDKDDPDTADLLLDDDDESEAEAETILTTQYDKDEVEELGGLKFDFLVTDILDVIQLCFNMVEASTGQRFTMKEITDKDGDKEVYAMLNAGFLQGVFQMETSGMAVNLFKKIQPQSISEISDISALNRPGPLDAGLVDVYILNKKLGKPPENMPSVLAEVLKSSHYTMIYQEQVMKLFSEVTGMTLREADDARRAMGKKNEKYMAKLVMTFIDKCVKAGFGLEYATQLFEDILGFSSYAFNRSHSVSYSHITYVTGWLKYHYPYHYFAAYLTIKSTKRSKKSDEKRDTFQMKLASIVQELNQLEIKIEPPNINFSIDQFTTNGEAIFYPLSAIKEVSKNSVREVIEKRGERPFKSVMDFTSRVHKQVVNVKCFKAFVSSGCFDSLGYCRTELLEKADEIYGYWRELRDYEDWIRSQALKKEEADRTGKKVRATKERLRPVFPVVDRLPTVYQPTKEELRLQLDAIGVYLGVHPASLIRDNSIVKTDHIPSSGIFRIGVIVSKIKEIKSKSGPMAFITFEDDVGSIEGVCFTYQWRNIKETINADTLCIAELKVNDRKPDSYIVNKIINWEKK